MRNNYFNCYMQFLDMHKLISIFEVLFRPIAWIILGISSIEFIEKRLNNLWLNNSHNIYSHAVQ